MTEPGNASKDPHRGQTIRMLGEPLAHARAAMILLHGRGARADDILSLTQSLNQPGFAYLAPQAAGNSWYPERFLASIASNEPWLSSALGVVQTLLAEVANAGIPAERVMLLGFSQGGCLALEFAARHGQRYAGVVGLSGALIGPPGEARQVAGSLAATPVFLGCSDLDPHVPRVIVEETASVLSQQGGSVTLRLYPAMGHTINQDEIDFVRGMMKKALEPGES